MGIVCYPVECPGCTDKIVLRLGVGRDERQPFFYVCGRCRAATKGALLWHGAANTSLELEDGQQLASEDGCAQHIHINPEYPSFPNAADMTARGGSAFIYHYQIFGSARLLQYQTQIRAFDVFVANGWPALRRLTGYYLNRDWARFDAGLEPLVEGAPPSISHEWKRHDFIHKIYDHTLSPLIALGGLNYPEMKAEWNTLLVANAVNFDALLEFSKEENRTTSFAELQRDLFHLIDVFIQLRRPLEIGLLVDQYPPERDHERKQLRLFRDDFSSLRDFYINAFEQCHKALRYAIGAINVIARGNKDAFPPWPSLPFSGAPNPLRSLAQFSNLSSANKRLWVKLLPRWDASWDSFFDRGLRNDIGHASVRHRLSDGVLVRDDNKPLSYLDFVRFTSRVADPILMMLNVMKMLLILPAMPVRSVG